MRITLLPTFKAAPAAGALRFELLSEGKRGNPVLLPASLFPAVAGIEGDTGARHIIEAGGASVIDVEIGAAASLDIDTPDDLDRIRAGTT